MVAAEPQGPPSKALCRPTQAGLRERQGEEEEQAKGDMIIPNTSVTTVVTERLPSPSLMPPPSTAAALISRVEAELEKQKVEERVEVEERKRNMNEKTGKKPFWLEDDELPPMM